MGRNFLSDVDVLLENGLLVLRLRWGWMSGYFEAVVFHSTKIDIFDDMRKAYIF